MKTRIKAFTMIELMVVMAIIAVLAGLTVWGMTAFRDSTILEQAVVEFVSTAKRIQNSARNSVLPETSYQQVATGLNFDLTDVVGYGLWFETSGSYSERFCLKTGSFQQTVDCDQNLNSDLRSAQYDRAKIASASPTTCSGIIFMRLSGDIVRIAGTDMTPKNDGKCLVNITSFVGGTNTQVVVEIDIVKDTIQVV